MVVVHSPKDEAELLILQGLLETEEIHFFVRNERFGGLYPGPDIWLFNRREILIEEADLERARELIADYLQAQEMPSAPNSPEDLPIKPRGWIASVLEFLLFGWFIPRR
jgi:hypothetical protein